MKHTLGTLGTALALLMGSSLPLSAQILGRVLDEEAKPVPDAAVRVVDADSIGMTVLTNADGDFQIPGAPLGEIRLEVTALGFGGSSRVIEYLGEAIHIDLRVTRGPVELEGLTVEVEARRPYLERSGFYRRNKWGTGNFLDFEIDPPRPVYRTAQLFQRIPGITVRDDEPVVLRHQASLRTSGASCLPIVFVDNALVRAGGYGGASFESSVPPPSMIAAVEVYKSGAFAPAQWRVTGSTCGVIAIWTKR